MFREEGVEQAQSGDGGSGGSGSEDIDEGRGHHTLQKGCIVSVLLLTAAAHLCCDPVVLHIPLRLTDICEYLAVHERQQGWASSDDQVTTAPK